MSYQTDDDTFNTLFWISLLAMPSSAWCNRFGGATIKIDFPLFLLTLLTAFEFNFIAYLKQDCLGTLCVDRLYRNNSLSELARLTVVGVCKKCKYILCPFSFINSFCFCIEFSQVQRQKIFSFFAMCQFTTRTNGDEMNV